MYPTTTKACRKRVKTKRRQFHVIKSLAVMKVTKSENRQYIREAIFLKENVLHLKGVLM